VHEFAYKILIFAVLKQRLLQWRETEACFVIFLRFYYVCKILSV